MVKKGQIYVHVFIEWPHIIIHSWTELRMWSIQRGDRIRWNDWKIPIKRWDTGYLDASYFYTVVCRLVFLPKKLPSISKILDIEADGIKILQEFRPKFQLEKQMPLAIHKAWLFLKLVLQFNNLFNFWNRVYKEIISTIIGISEFYITCIFSEI